MSATTKKRRKRRKTAALPATGTRKDVPHVGRAKQGCACGSCVMHRLLDLQAQQDRVREMIYEDTPMTPGSVQFSRTATSELISLLTGGVGR